MIIERDQRDRGRPRGVTLIEMMVVVSVLSVLIGLCAVTIQLLMKVGADAHSRREAASALGRLAEQFRADAHAAESAEIRPPSGLRLMANRGTVIEYAARDGRVTRTQTGAGPTPRHETFDLGPDGTLAFDRRDEEGRPFLALIVGKKSRAGRPDPPRPEEVVALIGKDRSRGGPAR